MDALSTIFHTGSGRDCYAADNETLHIRLQTGIDIAEKVCLWIGDPYVWDMSPDSDNKELRGWCGGEEIEMQIEAETHYSQHWFVAYKADRKRARYGFIVYLNDGRRMLVGESFSADITNPDIAEMELKKLYNFFCFPYIVPSDVVNTPSWVKETIWYQIYPDKFFNGDPSCNPDNCLPWGAENDNVSQTGGDLWGIIEKLDYLKELGITGVYFCPVFTAESNHKYDTIDYFSVDPTFGGNNALKTLIQEAHKRGIKVMLDAVFNHIGDKSPIWLDVVQNGENSRYAEWFYINRFPVEVGKNERDESGVLNYESFADIVEMPKLNVHNPECRDYLLEVTKYWTDKYKIDGWRLDVAAEVGHEFWRDFRRTVKAINPECYILGEIWHGGMNWLRGEQYDALMNYPLGQPAIDFFAHQDISKEDMINRVNTANLMYPKPIQDVMLNLLDSHDTSRIKTLCDGDERRTKLLFAFLFTQPGSTCIFYGSEIGMEGAINTTARNCMDWSEEAHQSPMKLYIKQLIQLRKENDFFKGNTIQWLETGSPQVIAYRMGRLTVVLSNSSVSETVSIEGKTYDLEAYGYKFT
ncbi:alpha amylase N-terminal ig-like domain-containing protein [Vibrio owensii]|uniref:alpha amylase N-terminal ig-like domain-containing protein n=1 Tax=Vibrio owensii TaxID=696485 RepID=UPI0040677653